MANYSTRELARKLRRRADAVERYLRSAPSEHVQRVDAVDMDEADYSAHVPDTRWNITLAGLEAMSQHFRREQVNVAAQPWHGDEARAEELLPGVTTRAPVCVRYIDSCTLRGSAGGEDGGEGVVLLRDTPWRDKAHGLFGAVARGLVRKVIFGNDLGPGTHLRRAFEAVCAACEVEVCYERAATGAEIAQDILHARDAESRPLWRLGGGTAALVHSNGYVEGPHLTPERAERLRELVRAADRRR